MKEHYYLDNAATTWPKPEPVYNFMDQFFRSHGVNPGRSGTELAVEAEQMIFQTRRLLAEFFNYSGDPNRVVFTQNATDSLNTALFGLLRPGDHVIMTRLEHNAVLRPLNHLQRDHGVAVTEIRRDGQGYVDPQDIANAITAKTKLVVVNHASNVLGSVQDIESIGKIVRESPATFVIDTCQSAGVLPIDMDGYGIDVLTFTGHKGLFGPMGIGGMIVREGIDIRPARVGGTGTDSGSAYQPDYYPQHLEAGTVSIPGIAGLNAAQKWFAELGRQQLGDSNDKLSHWELCRAALAHIDTVEHGHIKRLMTAAHDLDNVILYGPNGNLPRVATLTINIKNMPADQASTMLAADHGLCVRAGLHCAPLVHEDEGTMEIKGSVRLSPGYFTDDEDIEQAISGIVDIAA